MAEVKLNPFPLPHTDYYRSCTYCQFCGWRWDGQYGGKQNDCIRIMPAGFEGEGGYNYYRTGSCFMRQIERLQSDLKRAEERTRTVLDKTANLRNALKALDL